MKWKKNRLKQLIAVGLSTAIVVSGTALAVTDDSQYKDDLIKAEAAGTIYTSFHTGRWDNLQIEDYTGNYSVF